MFLVDFPQNFLRELDCKWENKLPGPLLLDEFGKDSRWGTKKYFIDSIGNRILPEIRNLKKPFGLLKKFLQENVEFQVFTQLSADKIKHRLH